MKCFSIRHKLCLALHKKLKSLLCCIVLVLYYGTVNFTQTAVMGRLEIAGFLLSEDLCHIKQAKKHVLLLVKKRDAIIGSDFFVEESKCGTKF